MVTPGKRIAHDIDLDAVEQAIRAAEQRTSGEIRVAIARSWFWGDARASAERAFRRMGMCDDAGAQRRPDLRRAQPPAGHRAW